MIRTLIAVNESDTLHPNAKWLFCILYGYANEGAAVVEEAKVARLMEIGADRLRAYRSQINQSDFASVRLSGGLLTFVVGKKWL